MKFSIIQYSILIACVITLGVHSAYAQNNNSSGTIEISANEDGNQTCLDNVKDLVDIAKDITDIAKNVADLKGKLDICEKKLTPPSPSNPTPGAFSIISLVLALAGLGLFGFLLNNSKNKDDSISSTLSRFFGVKPRDFSSQINKISEIKEMLELKESEWVMEQSTKISDLEKKVLELDAKQSEKIKNPTEDSTKLKKIELKIGKMKIELSKQIEDATSKESAVLESIKKKILELDANLALEKSQSVEIQSSKQFKSEDQISDFIKFLNEWKIRNKFHSRKKEISLRELEKWALEYREFRLMNNSQSTEQEG